MKNIDIYNQLLGSHSVSFNASQRRDVTVHKVSSNGICDKYRILSNKPGLPDHYLAILCGKGAAKIQYLFSGVNQELTILKEA